MSQGRPGRGDRAARHGRRIFAGAALSALLVVGGEPATADHVTADGGVVIATRESVRDTVNQVGRQTPAAT